ncbi:DivIVA domain-containing protein [Parolsenella catena]|uniref:DivIVA domain-containing protein n=1 Tax=Parolsenella catena TaxID=2003188 RepID=UPI001899012E|nr:DivIVA domain-containing protein [Parolsenella catena]
MAITPAEIDNLCFSPSKKGYDTDEVDAFLERCSSEVDAMLQKIADLKGRLTASEQQLAAAQAQIAQLQSQQPAEAAAPVTAPTGLTASETQISKVLIVAQQSADKIVAEARDNAEKIRNDADQKAREVIRQALAEKQSELDEMDRLKESREQFRDQYKALLQHFMDDADNAFSGQLSTSLPTGSAAAAQAAVSAPAATPAFDADATQLAQPSQLPMSGVDVDDLD